MVLCETSQEEEEEEEDEDAEHQHQHPVDLPLSAVLENIPQKTFNVQRDRPTLTPLQLDGVDVQSALKRVLRLPSVASKRSSMNSHSIIQL